MLFFNARTLLVNIQEVPLNVNLGHTGQCAMVLAQPVVDLVSVPQEGYRIADRARPASLEMVTSICKISNRALSDRALCQDYDNAHFLVLPELSVTTEGLGYLENYLANSCPNNTIISFGLEGVPWAYFDDLLTRSNNPTPQHRPREGTVDWVNCCVTLARENDGSRKLFVQSKFRESQWEEAPGRIFRGEDLLLFRLRGTHGEFNFTSLICSDLTAEHDGRTTIVRMLEDLERSIHDQPVTSLEVIFALQHNKSLSAAPFPVEITTVLNWIRGGFSFQRSALIFQNSASSNNVDDDNFGNSSFFFQRNYWRLPGSEDDPRPWYKGRPWPFDCKQFCWRIKKPGVFTLHYLPISSVGTGAGAPRLPFEHVKCYEIEHDGTLRDPTTSGQHICWEYLLDKAKNFAASLIESNNRSREAISLREFEAWLKESTHSCKTNLLAQPEGRLKQLSNLLFKCQKNVPLNYDFWTEQDQGRAMANAVHAATLMKLISADVRFDAGQQHTAVIDEQFNLAVLDGNDQVTHSEMLERYYRESDEQPWGDTTTLVLLSRSATFEPWEKATPQTGQYMDPISPDLDAGDENPHFSPKPRFMVGFLERMQNWRAIPARLEAEEYIRSYVGKI